AMVEAVKAGTARSAAIPGVPVGGKTGSAQNPQGRTHSWFVGFAPADNPQVAVAVVVENAGAGGAVAAPIAGRIMAKVLGR
ncbi:MAG: penicillin-binding transpeptidase domain-containing protein, partial [Moorellaceae bacterium]